MGAIAVPGIPLLSTKGDTPELGPEQEDGLDYCNYVLPVLLWGLCVTYGGYVRGYIQAPSTLAIGTYHNSTCHDYAIDVTSGTSTRYNGI